MVLSTTYKRPFSSHRSPIFIMSATCVAGLAMVSIKTMRVLSFIAAFTFSTEVASTKVKSSPISIKLENILREFPNKYELAITWSVLRIKAVKIAAIAAIPVEKAMVDVPFSIWVTLCSKAETVGLPWRE